jgi:hypothetical protein
MLGYLDALLAALTVRDGTEASRLLAHPLARLLPEDVRAEATAFVVGERDALAAPLRTMQLRFQTAELLRDLPIADQPESADAARVMVPPTLRSRRAPRPQQMELPLSA